MPIDVEETGGGSGGTGGGVSQQGWVALGSASFDLNESSTSDYPNWEDNPISGLSNSLSDGVLPSWITVGASPTLLFLETGTYLFSVTGTFVRQDSLEGATSFSGLTGEVSAVPSRSGGGSTSLGIVQLSSSGGKWDPANPVTQYSQLSVVSVPAVPARQNVRVQAGINVSEPAYFVQATVALVVTRIG